MHPLHLLVPVSLTKDPQPRFAILPGHEHKAFIPYSGVFAASPNKDRHAVIQAKVVSLTPREAILDREWQGSTRVPFDYFVAATGTRLAAPGTMPYDDKAASVEYLKTYNQAIKQSKSVILIGGGAVGKSLLVEHTLQTTSGCRIESHDSGHGQLCVS